MKLLVVAHMGHHRRDGRFVGWGPTVQEIDYLATLFDKVTVVACLHDGPAPASALPYASDRVRLVPVPPAGGTTLRSKLGVLGLIPRYARAILSELRGADVVQVRAPANIALIAILLLAMSRSPARRWVKYAGNWAPEDSDPLSFRLTRWLLSRNAHRGVVSINGVWPGQPAQVRSFANPCLTEKERLEAARLARGRTLTDPVRLLFAGTLEEFKGVYRVLEVAALLKRQEIAFRLDFVGGGPERAGLAERTASLGIADCVTFHGWAPRTELGALYAQAHFVLLPSATEGWPKVLSEAMAYGAVPLGSRVSSIPHYLRECGTGAAFHVSDVAGFANAVAEYRRQPERWRIESEHGLRAAELFTYETYLRAVRELLRVGEEPSAVRPPERGTPAASGSTST